MLEKFSFNLPKIIITITVIILFFISITINKQINNIEQNKSLLDNFVKHSQVKIQSIANTKISLIPTPRLIIIDLLIKHPQYGLAKIKKLELKLSLWPLLFGEIKAGSIYMKELHLVIKTLQKKSLYNYANKLLKTANNVHVSVSNSSISWPYFHVNIDKFNLNIPNISQNNVMTISSKGVLKYKSLPKLPFSFSSLVYLKQKFIAKNTHVGFFIPINSKDSISLNSRFNFEWQYNDNFIITDSITDFANIHIKSNLSVKDHHLTGKVVVPGFNLHETFKKLHSNLPFADQAFGKVKLDFDLGEKTIINAEVDGTKIKKDLADNVFIVDKVNTNLYKINQNDVSDVNNPWLLWLVSQLKNMQFKYKVQQPIDIGNTRLNNAVGQVAMQDYNFIIDLLAEINEKSKLKFNLNYHYVNDKQTITLELTKVSLAFWLNKLLSVNPFLKGVGDINFNLEKLCFINCPSNITGIVKSNKVYWQPHKISLDNGHFNAMNLNKELNNFSLKDLIIAFSSNKKNIFKFKYQALLADNLIEGYGDLDDNKLTGSQKLYLIHPLHNTLLNEIKLSGDVDNIVVSLSDDKNGFFRFSRSIFNSYKANIN